MAPPLNGYTNEFFPLPDEGPPEMPKSSDISVNARGGPYVSRQSDNE